MIVEFMETSIPGMEHLVRGFPRGSLIVVRGTPGTGKTVFAATCLYEGALRHGDPGVYVSLGEDREKFYEFMRGFGMDFEKLEKKGLFKFLSLPTVLRAGAGRLFAEIFEAVDSIKAKRLTIDPFTALSQVFRNEAEARTFFHTLLSNVMRELRCTTILIKEELEATKRYGFEDYVADTVIHLRASRLEGRFFREMTLVKIRGSEVRYPDISITLHQGFKAFPYQGVPDPPRSPKFEPPPDLPAAYTTGIPELDAEIGGFPHNSVVLWEIDPWVTFYEYCLVVAPSLASFLAKNRPFINLPSIGITWRDVRRLYIEYYGIPESKLNSLLRILTKGPIETEPPPYVKLLKGQSWMEVFEEFREVVHSLAREKGPHLVRLLGTDTLMTTFGEEVFKFFQIWESCFKETGGLAMWIAKPVHPRLLKVLSPMVDMHFKITRKHGCILLYGKKPRTALYAIRLDPDKSALVPKLIPIT